MNRFFVFACLLLLSAAITPTPLHAVDTWTGLGTNGWNDGNSWSNLAPPVAAENVVITGVSPAPNPLIDSSVTTPVLGIVNVKAGGKVTQTGGSLNAAQLDIGRQTTGTNVYNMSGGAMNISSWLGVGENWGDTADFSSEGYLNVSGNASVVSPEINLLGYNYNDRVYPISYGSLTVADTATLNLGKLLYIGVRGAVGNFNMTGGSVNITPTYDDTRVVWDNSEYNANNFGLMNIAGGTYTTSTGPLGTGILVGGINGSSGVMNVSGTGKFVCTGDGGLFGYSAGIINLGVAGTGGGIAEVPWLYSTGIVNFHGGTLKATTAGTLVYSSTGQINIYSEGITVDSNGKNVSINQPLVAPTGQGVSSIDFTAGSGYLAAPVVRLTGGDGSGATAVAEMEPDGAGALKIKSIKITNPGTGYNTAPTAVLIGGGGSGGSVGTIALADNASGGFTKTGLGSLALTASCTYTGATVVQTGTLSLDGINFASSGVTVQNGGTLAGYTNPDMFNIYPATTVQAGGTIAPSAAGAYYLHVDSLNLEGNSNLNFTIDSLGNPTRLYVENNVSKVGTNPINVNVSYTGPLMYDVTVLQIMGAGTIDPAITFSLPGGLPLLDSDDGIHAQTSIHTDYAAGQVQLKAGGVLATTQPCWNQAGGGSWNTGTNWGPPNEVPDHGDERGLFIQTLGGEIPISLNVSPTVSSLIFASPGGESYKITPVGSETITLESSIAQLAHITVLGGSHTVEAGVKLGAGTGPSAGRAIIRLADASHLTLSGVVSDATTASGLDISGNFNSGAGTGVLTLSGANTYTGPTMVTGGVLEAASIANYGAASSIGKPADASPANLVLNNATLRYIGTTAASTDRGLTVAGTNATLESNADLGLSGQIAATGTPNVTKNGVGTLTFNNAAAQANNLGGGVIVAQGKVVFAAGASTSYAMNQIVAGVTGGSAASVNLITGELNVNQRVALGDNTNAGILNQSGGVLTLNGGLYSSDDAPVIGKAAYGCLNVASGSLKFNGQAAGNLYQGVSNTGIINQTGGTIEIANACNYYAGGDDATAGYGLLNITGGDFKMSAEGVGPADGWGLILGIPGTAVLNVSGSGVVNLQGTGTAAKSYLFVSAREAATGIVNLGKVNAGSGGGGGTIANAAMVKEIAGASTFNFHGGTLVAAETTGLLALGVEGSFMDNIDHAYIYSEGARVSVADGHAATIAQAFEDPTGNGVSDASITITNGGSGYLAAPLVTISGGGPNASGATANAVLDSSGNLVDIVVTNPGVNYTEAPTITIAGGGGSGAEATVNPLALVANAAGPFVKVGAGVLTLTGASTRTGDTIVDAGTLNVMALNTPSATISVKDGAVLNVGSIIADTLTIGGAPEVNASAVPEPATWLLLILAGFGGLVAFWRRKP